MWQCALEEVDDPLRRGYAPQHVCLCPHDDALLLTIEKMISSKSSSDTPDDKLFRLQRLFDSKRFEDQDRALLEFSEFFAEVKSHALVSRGGCTFAFQT
jgi:hypothetical protein